MDKKYLSYYGLTQEQYDNLRIIFTTMATFVQMKIIPSPQKVYALTLDGKEDSTFFEP